MNIFEWLIHDIKSSVSWAKTRASDFFKDTMSDFRDLMSLPENLTIAAVEEVKEKIKNLFDGMDKFDGSVQSQLEDFYNGDGRSLEQILDYMKEALSPEDTYVRFREIYAELKNREINGGASLNDYEKEMLRSMEVELSKLGSEIEDAEGLWRDYLLVKDILQKDPKTLVEKLNPDYEGQLGGNPVSSGQLSDGMGSPYRPNQTEYNWGQGNNEDLLGIRETNNTFSGTDMVATINIPGREPVVFGELSQISYSTYREKVPVRSLGRITPKGYTRGYRTITGVLVFTVFDRSIVYECMKEIHKNGYKMLMDEMPVFDVTITMSNEFGHKSAMTIYGISTYSEGQMMGIDMIGIQNAYEFYAIDIDPMHRLDDNHTLKGSSVIDKNGNIIRFGTKDEEVNYYKEAYNYSLSQQKEVDSTNKFKFDRGN